MNLFPPPAALAPLVESLWAAETHNGVPRVERILPSGTTELVVDLRDEAAGLRMLDETPLAAGTALLTRARVSPRA